MDMHFGIGVGRIGFYSDLEPEVLSTVSKQRNYFDEIKFFCIIKIPLILLCIRKQKTAERKYKEVYFLHRNGLYCKTTKRYRKVLEELGVFCLFLNQLIAIQ